MRFLILPCLVLAFLLSGCSYYDNLDQDKPAAQTQKSRHLPPVAAQQQATGLAASRLQNQPWPPDMGQPYPPQGTMIPAPPPSPAYPQSQPSYAPALQSMRGKTQVALLVPLSGKNAPLGQAMLNAAQLAVFDIAPASFELMPRDTGASTESAVLAARDAIGSGAQLLIGPLFAVDVAAVKPVVETSGVNMLALSTDVSLAEPGAYVMGFAPAPQVERVVEYAARQGARRFAALIPAGGYGALVKDAFETAVRHNAGTIVAIESVARAKEVAAKSASIDALLLPLGGNELRQVAGQLAAGGLDRNKTHLLGTGLWDEPGLGQSMDILVGGWYAAAEAEARLSFVASYKKTYGQEPPRLATLAYDATALAAVLAAQHRGFDRASLNNPSGFAGLDGLFRLTPQGLAERGLALNEITQTGSRVIDPSPSTFAGRNTY